MEWIYVGFFCEKSLIESDPQTHVALASGLLICINKKKAGVERVKSASLFAW